MLGTVELGLALPLSEVVVRPVLEGHRGVLLLLGGLGVVLFLHLLVDKGVFGAHRGFLGPRSVQIQIEYGRGFFVCLFFLNDFLDVVDFLLKQLLSLLLFLHSAPQVFVPERLLVGPFEVLFQLTNFLLVLRVFLQKTAYLLLELVDHQLQLVLFNVDHFLVFFVLHQVG